jgi:adenosylhomocysteine nucleosidase
LTASSSVSSTGFPPSSATTPLKRVAIFAATSWEMEAVRAAFRSGDARRIDGMPVQVCSVGNREYWLVRTGMGLEKADQAAARLLAHQPFSLAVSAGFACALIRVDIGALLVGRDVVRAGGSGSDVSPAVEVAGDERDAVIELVGATEPSGHVGRFVSTDRVVCSASEKRRFASATGAIGLDMESVALAVQAQRAQVPFVIVRTASDPLDEDLPLDFNLFLRPTGWMKGVAALWENPSSVAGLRRLRRQSQAAAKNLTVFFRRYARQYRPTA